MMTRIPACRHIRTALSTSFLGGSNIPTQPTKVRSDWEEQTTETFTCLQRDTPFRRSVDLTTRVT